ncbi:hypothetical protein KOR42_15480 [Thalassoglobus neptunius]|uniref:Uncharacterized protein n=1 Tax=Thalassoglobus neptunius TaxID=1938619 RepID=A0A5C5X4Y3_9PLAN|nr:hypothetical protein KOR42_15480 [Thalassoglobus neptunius]
MAHVSTSRPLRSFGLLMITLAITTFCLAAKTEKSVTPTTVLFKVSPEPSKATSGTSKQARPHSMATNQNSDCYSEVRNVQRAARFCLVCGKLREFVRSRGERRRACTPDAETRTNSRFFRVEDRSL